MRRTGGCKSVHEWQKDVCWLLSVRPFRSRTATAFTSSLSRLSIHSNKRTFISTELQQQTERRRRESHATNPTWTPLLKSLSSSPLSVVCLLARISCSTCNLQLIYQSIYHSHTHKPVAPLFDPNIINRSIDLSLSFINLVSNFIQDFGWWWVWSPTRPPDRFICW